MKNLHEKTLPFSIKDLDGNAEGRVVITAPYLGRRQISNYEIGAEIEAIENALTQEH